MTTTHTTMSRLTQNLAAAGAAMLRVRWFVRAPIWLYRAGFGFLFGSRLLMLEHTGRKTGAQRYVVLEVVARPTPGTFIVASGFGAKADWFRNIEANSQVMLYLGGYRPRRADARILDRCDASAALADYASAHPRAWRTLRPVFQTTLGAQIDDQATTLPLVAFDLDNPGNTPKSIPSAQRPGQKPNRRGDTTMPGRPHEYQEVVMPIAGSCLSDVLASSAVWLLRQRSLVRAPIWLFRARLGFMWGSWLLLLEHTGRCTGQRRYVVLEVISRPRPGTYIVGSGLGARADWYRNIHANPRVHVCVGRHYRATATARALPAAETSVLLQNLAHLHPRRWSAMSPVFKKYHGGPLEDLPLIALELQPRWPDWTCSPHSPHSPPAAAPN